MQRLVNEKDHVVEDMLEGYVQAKSYIEYGGSEKRVVKLYGDTTREGWSCEWRGKRA